MLILNLLAILVLSALMGVYIKALGEELIDPDITYDGNAVVNIGATTSYVDLEYELFDKSDVLINKIEKLPTLRGCEIMFNPLPTFADIMIAAAGESLTCRVDIYNGSVEDDNLLYQAIWLYSNVSSGAAIYSSSSPNRKMNYLLSNKLIIRITITMDDTVAGAAFTADTIYARIVMDINWVKITEAELQKYAMETLYVNM